MENYIIANKTDVGRARQVNEDSMVTFDSPNGRVVAVCDGMGGQAAGDVASQLACGIIRDILENNTFATPLEAITRSMMAANQGILHRTAQDPQLEGMGATCVMLIIKNGVVYCGWVGDSRIYYISNHTIRQISKDQSYVQGLVDSGQITPEQAANHPQKNEITNALGLQGMTPPVLCQMPITPEPGSVFLLCSDGLTGMVGDAAIERTVSKGELSLHEKAERLVEMANQNGGVDNITVQLVEFKKGGTSAKSGGKGIKKGNVLMQIALAVFVVVIAGGSYLLFFNDGKENKTSEQQEIKDDRSRKATPKPAKETAPAVKQYKPEPADNAQAQGRGDGNAEPKRQKKPSKTGRSNAKTILDSKKQTNGGKREIIKSSGEGEGKLLDKKTTKTKQEDKSKDVKKVLTQEEINKDKE